MSHWLYTIGGLERWTGLVDWTTGLTDLYYAVTIDPAGSQYIDYANAFTHAHLRLASISLAKLSSKL